MALVSLAGPATNLLLAIVAALLIRLMGPNPIFSMILTYNILLAIFNLLPIPPLDGSKVFSLLLPEREANSYLALGSVGFFILFALLAFPLGGFNLGRIIFDLSQFAQNLLLR